MGTKKMALNYLKSNQLQDQLQNSIQALAISRPNDLYHALGQDLANFTKAPEIVDQKVVPESEDAVTVCRSPLNFITPGKFQITTINYQNQKKSIKTFFQNDGVEANNNNSNSSNEENHQKTKEQI